MNFVNYIGSYLAFFLSGKNVPIEDLYVNTLISITLIGFFGIYFYLIPSKEKTKYLKNKDNYLILLFSSIVIGLISVGILSMIALNLKYFEVFFDFINSRKLVEPLSFHIIPIFLITVGLKRMKKIYMDCKIDQLFYEYMKHSMVFVVFGVLFGSVLFLLFSLFNIPIPLTNTQPIEKPASLGDWVFTIIGGLVIFYFVLISFSYGGKLYFNTTKLENLLNKIQLKKYLYYLEKNLGLRISKK